MKVSEVEGCKGCPMLLVDTVYEKAGKKIHLYRKESLE